MSKVGHDTYSDLVIDSYSEVSNRPGVLATLSGRFSVTNENSRNGNEYTPELWEDVINSDRIQEMIENKTFFGELSHPPRDAEFLTEVQMNNVSHNITDISFDKSKGEVTGTIDILDTPSGRIANTFLKYGSRLGISSRGVTLDDGTSFGSNRMTPDNYFLVTWDLVAMPGVRGARLDPVTESVIPSMAKSKLRSSKENFRSSLESAIKAKDTNALKIFKACVESSNIKGKSKFLETIDDALESEYSNDYNKEYGSQGSSSTVDTSSTTSTEEPELNEMGNTKVSNELKEVEDTTEDNTTNVSETTQASDVIGPTSTLNMVKATHELKEMRKPMKEAYDTLEDDDEVEITLNKSQLANLIDILSEPDEDVNMEIDTTDPDDETTVTITKTDSTSSETVTESDEPEFNEDEDEEVIEDEVDDNAEIKGEVSNEIVEDEPIEEDIVEDEFDDSTDTVIMDESPVEEPLPQDDIVTSSGTLEEIKSSINDLSAKLQETIDAKDEVIEKLTAERDSAITESLMYKKKFERSESQRRVLKESYNSLESKKNAVIKKLSNKNRELLSKSAKSANESVSLRGAVNKSRTTIANQERVIESLRSENQSLRRKLDSETGRIQNSRSTRQSKFRKLAENADLLSIRSEKTPEELSVENTVEFVTGVMTRSRSK